MRRLLALLLIKLADWIHPDCKFVPKPKDRFDTQTRLRDGIDAVNGDIFPVPKVFQLDLEADHLGRQRLILKEHLISRLDRPIRTVWPLSARKREERLWTNG